MSQVGVTQNLKTSKVIKKTSNYRVTLIHMLIFALLGPNGTCKQGRWKISLIKTRCKIKTRSFD